MHRAIWLNIVGLVDLMLQENQTRRAGGAAGLGNVNRRAAEDTRDNSTSRRKFQRLVERLHALGPGVLAYFIREVAAGADVCTSLEIYAALPGDFIRAYGADRFPPTLHSIDGGGR